MIIDSSHGSNNLFSFGSNQWGGGTFFVDTNPYPAGGPVSLTWNLACGESGWTLQATGAGNDMTESPVSIDCETFELTFLFTDFFSGGGDLTAVVGQEPGTKVCYICCCWPDSAIYLVDVPIDDGDCDCSALFSEEILAETAGGGAGCAWRFTLPAIPPEERECVCPDTPATSDIGRVVYLWVEHNSTGVGDPLKKCKVLAALYHFWYCDPTPSDQLSWEQSGEWELELTKDLCFEPYDRLLFLTPVSPPPPTGICGFPIDDLVIRIDAP